MAGAATLVIDFGTPITGIWCNACMTSAGVGVPVNRMSEFGVTTITVAYACGTCKVRGPGALDL